MCASLLSNTCTRRVCQWGFPYVRDSRWPDCNDEADWLERLSSCQPSQLSAPTSGRIDKDTRPELADGIASRQSLARASGRDAVERQGRNSRPQPNRET
jgi:hypothetical protein